MPFSAPPEVEGVDDAEDQRRSVREWMQKKKMERMAEFRQRLQQLRDAEHRPFQPSNKSTKQV